MSDPNDLVALADLKAWLGMTASGDDTLLSALITAASYDFLGRVDRPSLTQVQAFSERYDGTGGCRLLLRQYPVIAVSSVTVGQILVPQSPDYVAGGWVADEYGVTLVGGAYSFCRGRQNVLVSYSAGFVSAPADVTQAAKTICAAWYRRRSHLDQESQSLEGQNIRFAATDIPPEALAVVDRYRRLIPA